MAGFDIEELEDSAVVRGKLNAIDATVAATSAVTANSAKRTYPSADEAKLAGIEPGATKDQSNTEIETAYNAQVAAASQAEAEAGTETAIRRLSPLRIAQAIAALASAGLNTLAKLNAIFTDGTTLIDTTDARLSDARTPLSHAASHTDGSDDVQSATNAQKGLATAAQITTLEANAVHAALVAGNPHAVTASEVGLGSVENTALSTWGGSSSIVTVGTVVSGTWSGTPIAVAKGGTGQATAQAAIDALTQVSGATNEHVLTKDTATGNAVFKAAAGGGVTDHGALTGLADDDHTQYHTDARGDARYSVLAHTHSAFSQDTAGFAPGPTASDISSNYVLQADGDWVENAGGGGGFSVTNESDNRIITSLGVGLGGNAESGLWWDGSAFVAEPASDSVTMFQVQNAAGASILNVDSTNQRVGIGTTAPTDLLHVKGSVASLSEYLATFENNHSGNASNGILISCNSNLSYNFALRIYDQKTSTYVAAIGTDGTITTTKPFVAAGTIQAARFYSTAGLGGDYQYMASGHTDGIWQIVNNTDSFREILRLENSSFNVMEVQANGKIGLNNDNPTAQFQVNAINATNIIGIVKGHGSQTANRFEWQSSTGTVDVAIGPTNSVLLLGAATPTGTVNAVVAMKANSGDPTMASATGGFFCKDVSGTVEAFAIDSGSAATQLTGHADDAPPAFYELGPKKGERVGRREIPWIGIVRNGVTYDGLVEWTYEIRRPTASVKPYTVRESFAQYVTRMQATGQMTPEQAATYVPQNVANENTARNTAWQAKRQQWLDEVAKWRRTPRSLRGDMPRLNDPKPIPIEVA